MRWGRDRGPDQGGSPINYIHPLTIRADAAGPAPDGPGGLRRVLTPSLHLVCAWFAPGLRLVYSGLLILQRVSTVHLSLTHVPPNFRTRSTADGPLTRT